MKGGNVLVEVDGKEIKSALSGAEGIVVGLKVVVEIVGSLGGNGADLFIAASVAGDEEDGDALDL